MTLDGIMFPDGGTGNTRSIGGGAPVRRRNAQVARSLDLSGKRVLDVGCGVGLYALYMADSAAEVVGIDHQESRIYTAEATRARIGYDNVTFKVADIRDPGFLDDMGRFDLVVAWGVLHRVPDIFTLLLRLSEIADAFSLEWTSPLFPLMGRSVSARHRGGLDCSNLRPVGSLAPAEIAAQKVGGTSGFWFPTPCAVAAILKNLGVEHLRVLGYGEGLKPQWVTLLRSLPDVLKGNAYARVHILAEKSMNSITLKDHYTLPTWDTAARAYLQ